MNDIARHTDQVAGPLPLASIIALSKPSPNRASACARSCASTAVLA